MPEIRRLSEEIGSTKISAIKRSLNHNYPLHWHEYYEVEYILSGSGVYVINDTEYPFEEGTLFFLTPIDFASIDRISEDITLLNVSFSEYWISEKIAKQLNSHAVIKNYSHPYFFENVYSELSHKKQYSSTYIKYNLNCALIDILRFVSKISEKSSDGKMMSVISDTLSYIHTHFREDPSLTEISEYIGMSPNYLSTLFHSYTGKTYKSYLIDLKLKYASALLLQTSTSVTDICYMCGFNSFAHFMRTFKSEYNTTPSRYRKDNAGKFDE